MKSKKIIKAVCCILAVPVVAALLFTGRYIYVSKYKTAYVDSSVSADGTTQAQALGGYDSITDVKKESLLNRNADIKQFDIEVMNNRKNELVFDFSMNDFIESFNGYYFYRNKKSYIQPASFDNWQKETLSEAIHSPHETVLYNYSADRKVWSLPTVSVYVPTNGDFVQEITLDFDWHSYSDNLYDLYNEMCYCTLKIFFPDFSDEQITALYSKVNKSGYDNMFSVDDWYSKDSIPAAFFYKDGIGVYSHFAEGSYQRLCIIPVTENTVNEFKQKGSEIIEIK